MGRGGKHIFRKCELDLRKETRRKSDLEQNQVRVGWLIQNLRQESQNWL